MLKWMSRVATSRGKSLLPSTIITLVIVAMLLISGPAQAVAVIISGNQGSYTKGEDIDFQLKIELNDKDKYVPLTNISLDLIGNVSRHAVFSLDGTRISGTCNIKMKPISVPNVDDYGSGYGYDSGYGYNFGYGYGYGYGYGGGGAILNFIYNVTIETTCLQPGHYDVVATLNTDQKIAFQDSFDFELEPGNEFNADVEIKPETLNIASKGIFTAFITSDEFDIEDIKGNSVIVTCDGCNSVHAVNWNIANNKFIAKFRTEDLENVDTGDVTFIVTGKLKNDDIVFKGSDTVKVIDQGKGQKEVEECECDDHAKEDDHDDECDDDDVKEHNHEDDKVKKQDHDDDKVKEQDQKKAKDQKPQINKDDHQKNKNNGGQARNNIVNNNNIYITNNTGTVNINIYNQGSGTDVNQGGNNNNNANGNKKGNQGNSNNKGNNGIGNNGKSKK